MNYNRMVRFQAGTGVLHLPSNKAHGETDDQLHLVLRSAMEEVVLRDEFRSIIGIKRSLYAQVQAQGTDVKQSLFCGLERLCYREEIFMGAIFAT